MLRGPLVLVLGCPRRIGTRLATMNTSHAPATASGADWTCWKTFKPDTFSAASPDTTPSMASRQLMISGAADLNLDAPVKVGKCCGVAVVTLASLEMTPTSWRRPLQPLCRRPRCLGWPLDSSAARLRETVPPQAEVRLFRCPSRDHQSEQAPQFSAAVTPVQTTKDTRSSLGSLVSAKLNNT